MLPLSPKERRGHPCRQVLPPTTPSCLPSGAPDDESLHEKVQLILAGAELWQCLGRESRTSLRFGWVL